MHIYGNQITFNLPKEQQNWAKFDEEMPPPLPPPITTNPDHEDYLTPRPAPRKPPPKPKPYAASKAEKQQQEAAVAEGRLPLCTSLLIVETFVVVLNDDYRFNICENSHFATCS